MHTAMLGGDGARRAAVLGAVLAALVLAFLGYIVFLQRRETPEEIADLAETLDRTEGAPTAPAAGSQGQSARAQPGVQVVTDASSLFTIDLPVDWHITRNEGRKGIQLSFLGAQSPDFLLTLDETAEQPFVPRRYERGAEFSAHVVRGRSDVVEEGARTVGLLESSPVTIGGVSGVLRAGAGISTVQGRNLDAIIHRDGLNYIFTFGYNPATTPDGDHMFRALLASIQFTTSARPPPGTPATVNAPASPPTTPTPSPYVYQRPNVWE